MEPLPQPPGPWTDISVNFIVCLPVSCLNCHAKPHNAILVCVSWYTKQARYFPGHNTLDTVGLAEILTERLVLWGADVL
jgi:hypothetical protein